MNVQVLHWWILFFSSIPYLYIFFQFPGQVQPIAHLLSIALLVATFRSKINLSNVEMLIIAFSIFFIVYLYEYSIDHFLSSIRKSIGFLIGLPIYFVAKRIRAKPIKKILFIVAILYLSVACIQIISHSTYLTLGELFFETRQSLIGARGASSIAPEAADFGFICSYLLFFCYVMFALNGPSLSLGVSSAILIICLLLSGSASGIVSLVLWGLAVFFSNKKFSLRPYIFGIGFFILFYLFSSVRGVEILYLTLTNPFGLIDTSAAHRISHNVVSIYGLFESGGFGYGAGSFTNVASSLYEEAGLSSILGLNGHYANAVYDTLNNHFLSVFAQLCLEYGLFGLVYLFLVFMLAFKSQSPFKKPIIILMILTWAQSFPSAFPLFWLVLGISYNKNFNNKMAT